MVSQQNKWRAEADAFLRQATRKSKFKNAPSHHEGAVVVRRGGGGSATSDEVSLASSSRDHVLRALFASFLDLFCDTVPPANRQQVKTELCSTLAQLRLVPSSFFAEEFSSVRRAFSSLITNVVGNVFVPPPTLDSPLQVAGNMPVLTSRYRTDFEEVEEIGEGGFGTVFKAKSRVDNCLYAVKKIKLKHDFTSLSLKVLNEVQVLASLHHENVVRYHCGWIEMAPPVSEWAESPRRDGQSQTGRVVNGGRPMESPVKITEIFDDGDSSVSEDELATSSTNTGLMDESEGGVVTESGSELGNLMVRDTVGRLSVQGVTKENTTSNSFDPSFSASSRGGNAVTNGRFWGGGGESTTEESQSVTTEQSVLLTRRRRRETVQSEETQNEKRGANSALVAMSWKPTVYIQMELCTMTLEEYFIKRNKEKKFLGVSFVDGAFNRELCVQLLSAIEYIHANHLIHRDIKPSNIFLKHQGDKIRFLVGDFGLACGDQATTVDKVPRVQEDTGDRQLARRRRRHRRSSSLRLSHSIGVGTSTYAAPEQLNTGNYGPTVDIYSVGIVLLEAYTVFSTSMERSRAIDRLRQQGQLPEETVENWPTVSSSITRMTDRNPSLRPTASQLLQQYKADESSTVSALREIISSQERELKLLRAELAQLRVTKSTN